MEQNLPCKFKDRAPGWNASRAVSWGISAACSPSKLAKLANRAIGGVSRTRNSMQGGICRRIRPCRCHGHTHDLRRDAAGLFRPQSTPCHMDLGHIEAQLCFPSSFPRFCGQTFSEIADRELGLACIEAYNNWMVDEWCGGSQGRLVPLIIVPLWDPELAAAEVRRNAKRGVRADDVFSLRSPPIWGCRRSTRAIGTRSSAHVTTSTCRFTCTSVRHRRCR